MDVALFRHRLLPPLFLLALACACATAKPRPDAQEVDDLSIKGTDKVDDGDIKAKILTTETPWWEPLWPFDNGPSYYDPNAWQADLRRIERYYQSQGYYQAQVVSNEVKPSGKDQVALEATVTEGAPTTIGAVKVSGMEALPQDHQRRAQADLPLKEKAVFREEDWVGVKELIQGRLRELGYAEAEVGGEVQVDVGTHTATVDLQVKPGPRYKFGNVFVATDPDPKVAPRRIIEQAQGAVRKGDWFSESALAEAQARVFGMGVFGAVKVNRGAPDPEAVTVPVVVDVREAPLRSVRLGGGFGVDITRQEGRVLAEWTNRNIFGGLRRLTVRGRVGYAFLPSIYSTVSGDENAKSGVVFDATTEFEQPRFLFRDVRLQASVSGEKGLEQAYSFVGGRTRTGLIWQPHPDLSVFPSYNLEVYFLSGKVGTDAIIPPITLGCRERDLDDCTIALSYLETTVAWDRRDDSSEPRNGYYASLSLQGGGGPLFGDFNYVRVLPDLRYYHSFGLAQRLTLAGKVRLGTLIPFSRGEEEATSSIVTRFFSGGGNSMRGFNSRRLSPQVAVDPSDPTAGTVPVGGNSLVETSLEVRYRLTESLVVASFWDTGYVGQESLKPGFAARNELYHAVGLGLRYLTVVGPLRVDIARRLNIGPPLFVDSPGYTYPSSGSCFGLGGKKTTYAGAPEGLCTFQLSIGEAF
ncbi:BamA/OMP85 family outer membrane protein [Hyalangium rubrum]|uniref:BamA/TamA family outer membrane protein n=1 Tax=Hyalangium rubrum TaxID=3103134 RepID=A0ABU5H1Y1_9BACT|nr:BamA/TamA family outer membrane protein [Hyalangium sp. s54d21]MDY7227465.1 BamA/TamA family outer membrane protein [Hyalangium sp. s54d21]